MSGKMPRPVESVALVATVLMYVTSGVPPITARADDCLTEPNAPAPEGSHWYYHLDRASQQKCWYMRATDPPAQRTVEQAPASAPHPPPITPERSGTASVSASTPMSISPGNSTPPLLQIRAGKPRQTTMTSATTDQSVRPVRLSKQKETPASSMPEVSTAQPRISSQATDQGAIPAAATPAWPDPSVAAVTVQQPIPNDDQTETVQPLADVSVSTDADDTARGNASKTKRGRAVTLTSSPAAIFPIAALGLTVACFLFRVVSKNAAARRQPNVIDDPDSDWIDERHQSELRDDQLVHRGIGLNDYLQRSVIPAARDSDRPRQLDADEELPENTRSKDSTSPTTARISRRKLRQIVDRRDSDWIDDGQEHDLPNDHVVLQEDALTDD